MSTYTAAKTGKHPVTITTPNDLEIHISREFDAPRDLVFAMWTDPKHIRQWWGPEMMEMTVCDMDVRPGGKWRIVHRTPDGQEHGFHGEYLEVVRPERLVQTLVYEPYPDHGSVETGTWTELPERRTHFTGIVRHASKEGRDGHLNAGMEGGLIETYARLDDLLARLA